MQCFSIRRGCFLTCFLLFFASFPRFYTIQSWFPDFLQLCCARPILLPLRKDRLSQFKGRKVHQNLSNLHLHAWFMVRESLRQDGFSDRAAKRISSSVRKSTGAIYDSKWNICSWCRSKEIDPLTVTVQQLAEFLVYLFEDKDFSPFTFKGYRSALSRTIALSGGPDFGKNEFLSLMVKNFCLERPRQRRLVPSWNLALVLRTLQFPPFEPLSLASFKFLTLKCCFFISFSFWS